MNNIKLHMYTAKRKNRAEECKPCSSSSFNYLIQVELSSGRFDHGETILIIYTDCWFWSLQDFSFDFSLVWIYLSFLKINWFYCQRLYVKIHRHTFFISIYPWGIIHLENYVGVLYSSTLPLPSVRSHLEKHFLSTTFLSWLIDLEQINIAHSGEKKNMREKRHTRIRLKFCDLQITG